jgi:hypothetical protein
MNLLRGRAARRTCASALKFTEHGGRITLRAERHLDAVRLGALVEALD